MTHIFPFGVFRFPGGQRDEVGICINGNDNAEERLLSIVLFFCELDFRLNAVEIPQIIGIDIVQAEIFKSDVHISFSSQKNEGICIPPYR